MDAELKKKGKKRKYTRHTNDNDDFSGESDDGSAVSGDSNDLFESYENSNIANEQPKSKRTSKRDVVVKPKTKKSIKAIKHEELDGKDHVSLGTSTSHAVSFIYLYL